MYSVYIMFTTNTFNTITQFIKYKQNIIMSVNELKSIHVSHKSACKKKYLVIFGGSALAGTQKVLFWYGYTTATHHHLWLIVSLALQHHGTLCLSGASDREVRQGVFQRNQSLHHVRGAALRRPHSQTLH